MWQVIVTTKCHCRLLQQIKAKVMFLQVSVCPQGEYLGRYPPWAGTPLWPGTPPDQVHPPGQGRPPPGDGWRCGRYASYWNAFLFWWKFWLRCHIFVTRVVGKCDNKVNTSFIVTFLLPKKGEKMWWQVKILNWLRYTELFPKTNS